MDLALIAETSPCLHPFGLQLMHSKRVCSWVASGRAKEGSRRSPGGAVAGRAGGSVGLKLPASDADTRAWLRLKGIRDVASGFVVLTMMLTADKRLVGTALLVYTIIPFGDISIVLGSGGSKSRAFSLHGVTCAVMLVVGLLLIHAI